MKLSSLPEFVIQDPLFKAAALVYHKLNSSGFQSYFAGGCVRDILLGRRPHDYDLATAARPEQVQALFPKTVAVGAQFGVIVVLQDDHSIEVATFREEGGYSDGRRPTSVRYSGAEKDAERRDFTINAMFLSLDPLQILDFTQGLTDIQGRCLRAVGSAQERFSEDHLRIFRAIRFAAQLNFSIEPTTWQAVLDCKELLAKVSRERIREELEKLLSADYFAEKGVFYLQKAGVLQILFPELVLDLNRLATRLDRKQLWRSFFQQAWLSGTPWSALENSLQSLKFSNTLKTLIRHHLFFFIHPETLKTWRLGRLLEFLLQPEVLGGLQAYAAEYSARLDSATQERIQELLRLLPEQKPVAWVSAKDLMPEFSGPELGLRLKWAYWLQLEKGAPAPSNSLMAPSGEQHANLVKEILLQLNQLASQNQLD